MEHYIKVAEKNIKIVTNTEEELNERFREYQGKKEDAPDALFSAYRTQEIQMPEGKIICQTSAVTYILAENGCIYRCYYGTGKKPCCLIKDSADIRRVEIQMTHDCAEAMQMKEAQWEYICRQSAFCRFFTGNGGLVLHGSGIRFGEYGILFSADSGVGKSTHASLWKQYYPEETVILNDDKPAFTFEEESVWMHGTPWSGKTAENHNAKAALTAVVMLKRGTENKISRLTAGQAFACLVPQICAPVCHTGLMEAAVARLQQMLGQIPVYQLSCRIDREAVEVVRRKLAEENQERTKI